jgi:farnesyl-diphosphate farnesyltransferase
MTQHDTLQDLLQKTSRTFALTIPLLPEPTRREVSVGYLLFRIIDTFEDASDWLPEKRVEALAEFVRLLEDDADPQAAAAAAARWLRDPPLAHAGYLELIEHTPLVLEWQRGLAPAASTQIRQHLVRTAQGMADFVNRSNGAGNLRLETLSELREYCYVVAGIVGQLLTELYLLGRPQLEVVAPELRARAVRFGEGLQLINILKDAQPDAAEGRVYLPPDLTLPDAFALARADLVVALEYTELLRAAQADFGVVAFNALNARLALATLRVLRDQGLGSKLTRVQLTGLADDVMRSIQSGASLFPEP